MLCRRRLEPQVYAEVLAGLLALSFLSAAGCSGRPADSEATTPTTSAESLRARQLRDLGRFDEALTAYDVARDKNPIDGAAQLEPVMLLLHLQRLSEAEERARRQLEETPTSPYAQLAMAQVAFRRGNLREARRLLDRAAGAQHESSNLYVQGARLYRALGRTGRGTELLERLQARGDADPEALELLGDCYFKMTQARQSARAFQAALASNPGSGTLHRKLGRSLLMMNRKEEAREHFSEALRLQAEEPYSLYYLGALELEAGNPLAAAELLNRSLARDEMNPKARYALARSLAALGRAEEAAAEYERHALLMKRLYHTPTSESPGPEDTGDEPPGTSEWDLDISPPSTESKELGPSPTADASARRFDFVDRAWEAGIRSPNVSGGLQKDYIIESLGSGACWLDYDRDGWLDLFLPNGLPMGATSGVPPADALYRNLGDGRFEEATDRAGLRDTGWGHGCAVGDYDNDSDPDLYVTNRGPNAMFRNNGGGTFTEVGRRTGTDDPGWSTSAAFADYDRDGFLDLVVANYIEFGLETTPRPGAGEFCRILSMPTFCGPRGLPKAKNRLYRNRGDGTFEDVTSRAGFRLDRGFYSLGVVWADYDNDGDPDLYCATDSTPNLLYRNDGDGTFIEVGTESGVAYSEEGLEQAGMGTDMADFDNDGDFDFVVTNFAQDNNALYRQDRPGFFSDASYASGIGEPSLPYLGWGVGFVDFDNDGRKDLFVANGHTQPQVDQYTQGTTYRQRNLLYVNRGDGTFEEVGLAAGPGLAPATPSRGAAFADFDNDGDLDILVNNIDETPNLLVNRAGDRSHWIGFKLIGTRSNRDAVGARVTLRNRSGLQVAEVRSGYSYLSSNDLRVVLGLGSDPGAAAGEIRIRWPRGTLQTLTDLPIDRYHTLREPSDERRK